jgi:hypothetical protein
MLSEGKGTMVPLLSATAPYWFAMGVSWLYQPGLPFTHALTMTSARVLRAGLTSYRCAIKLVISPRSSHVRIMTSDPDLEVELRFSPRLVQER